MQLQRSAALAQRFNVHLKVVDVDDDAIISGLRCGDSVARRSSDRLDKHSGTVLPTTLLHRCRPPVIATGIGSYSSQVPLSASASAAHVTVGWIDLGQSRIVS